MKIRAIGKLIKDSGVKFWDDNGPRLSAAITFYLILSLYPLALTVVAIAGMIFGREAARESWSRKSTGPWDRTGQLSSSSWLPNPPGLRTESGPESS